MDQSSEDVGGSVEDSRLRLFWLAWVGASTVAAALAWFLAIFGFIFTFGFSALLGGPIIGVLMGWTQERVLRTFFPKEIWAGWILRTVIGASLAWGALLLLLGVLGGLASLSPLPLDQVAKITACVIAGSVLGLVQGRGVAVLHGMRLWVLWNAIGWGIAGLVSPVLAGPFVGPPISPTLFFIPDAIYFFVLGTVSVLLLSLVTATTLVALIRERRIDSETGQNN